MRKVMEATVAYAGLQKSGRAGSSSEQSLLQQTGPRLSHRQGQVAMADDQFEGGCDPRLGLKDDHLARLLPEVAVDAF